MMKSFSNKRILSLFMALAMVFSIVTIASGPAYAAGSIEAAAKVEQPTTATNSQSSIAEKQVQEAPAVVQTAASKTSLNSDTDPERVEINLLSFNDFHGTVDNSASSSNPGMARFTAVAKQLLEDKENAVLLAGGDNYQGSAISNYFLGGPVSDMMKELAVPYSALGNHEYDWGPQVISKFADDADIKFLAANVFVSGTDERPDYVEPYATLEIAGKKIGLVGWAHTSTPTLVTASHVKDVEFRSNTADNWFVDEVTKWKEQEGWDAVVALTHDSLRGENLVGVIDAIILGHTHSHRVTNYNGIPAVEASYNGRSIGNVTLVFEGDELDVSVSSIGSNGVTGTTVLPSGVIDEGMQAVYQNYYDTVKPIFDEQVGVFGEDLNNRAAVQAWASQIVYDFIVRTTGEDDYVLIQNSGGWRDVGSGQKADEAVDYWFLNTLMPFDNEIYLFQLDGEYLLNLLNGRRVNNSGSTSSGITNGAYRQDGNWYLNATDEQIVPGTLYKVSMNDFMFTGGDNFGVVANESMNPPLTEDYAIYDYETLIIGVPLREALADQLRFRMNGGGVIDDDELLLTIDNSKVFPGEQFGVNVAFKEAVESNTATVTLSYDSDKFNYDAFMPADGVEALRIDKDVPGTISITVMIRDYNTKDYGTFYFTAKSDATLDGDSYPIEAMVEYVLRDAEGNKTIETAKTSGFIVTGEGEGGGSLEDGKATLIDLSNAIDRFGYTRDMAEWDAECNRLDVVKDNKIDIQDIMRIAQMIPSSTVIPDGDSLPLDDAA